MLHHRFNSQLHSLVSRVCVIRSLPVRLYSTPSAVAPNPTVEPNNFATVEDHRNSFLEGRFDRKPKKQSAWVVSDLSGVGGRAWNMGQIDANHLSFSSGCKVSGLIELRIKEGSKISIGSGTTIDDRAILQCGEAITIGANCSIGKGALLMDRNHHGIGNDPKEIISPITIGDNCIIGDHVVILPGCSIPAGTTVLPGSVVTGRKTFVPSGKLLPVDRELEVRRRLAHNEPVLDVPEDDRVCDLRSIIGVGNLKNMEVSLHKSNFYGRPWRAPIFAANGKGKIRINSDSFIHNSTQIFARGATFSLGKFCNVSWRAVFLTEFDDQRADVVIEDQVWIGANVILLPGTRIGRGSLVGAGSVVQGDIPPWSVCVGNPGAQRKVLEPFEGKHGGEHN